MIQIFIKFFIVQVSLLCVSEKVESYAKQIKKLSEEQNIYHRPILVLTVTMHNMYSKIAKKYYFNTLPILTF